MRSKIASRSREAESKTALIFVDEEDGQLRSLDRLLDLIVSEILVEAGLLVESMGLVDDQDVERPGRGVGEGSRSLEEIRDPRLLERTGQFALVDRPRRGVLRDVLRDQLALRHFDEEVDRDDRLPRPGPAPDDQDRFPFEPVPHRLIEEEWRDDKTDRVADPEGEHDA